MTTSPFDAARRLAEKANINVNGSKPWRYGDDGLFRIGSNGDERRHIGFSVEPLEVLRTNEHRSYLHVKLQGRDIFLPDEWPSKRDSDAALMLTQAGLPVSRGEVRPLQDFVAWALREGDLPVKPAFDRLGWEGEEFLLPDSVGSFYIPKVWCEWIENYGQTSPDEQTARDSWAVVIENAAVQAPVVIVAVGAALAAPLMARLSPYEFISFLVNLHTPGTATGKTTVLLAAAATQGGPADLLVRPWNTTKSAAEIALGSLRNLVMILDELGDAKFGVPEDLVMMLAEDKGRARATGSGGLRPVHSWRTIVLSSGNEPIAEGSAHHARRILSVPSALPDELWADTLMELARDGYGWPLRWMLPHYGTVREQEVSRAALPYQELYTGPIRALKPQANLWAVIDTAARLFFGVLGLDGQAAHEAIFTVARQSAERRRMEGLDYVARFLEAVQGDMANDPAGYGVSVGGHATPRRGYRGRVLERSGEGDPARIALLPNIAKEIARYSGIPDLTGVLMEARERGLLEPNSDRSRLQRKVRIGGGLPAWCYVLTIAE